MRSVLLQVLLVDCAVVFASQWTQLPSPIWGRRTSFLTVVRNHSIAIVGGGGYTEQGRIAIMSDVWVSGRGGNEGAAWNQVASSIPWSAPRDGMMGGVHPSLGIVMAGGCAGGFLRYNDVLASADGGMSWKTLTINAGWSTRCCHAVVIVGSTIYVMGGHDMLDAPSGPRGYKNDVWSSSDGVRWAQLASAPWEARDALAAVVVGNAVVIMGGHSNERFYNDVWRWSPGSGLDTEAQWASLTMDAAWARRGSHGAVAAKSGDLYVMGGWGGAGSAPTVHYNDVWYSADGASWSQLDPAPWVARTYFGLVADADGLYLLGGMNATGGFLGDVWKFEFPSRVAPSVIHA